MKILSAIGIVLLLMLQFLCLAQAMELCEPQDYYNLANSTKCKIKYNKAGDKGDSREAMFEIMKNYPYEDKIAFVKLLQRKIELIDNYKIQQQGKAHTEKIKSAIVKLEQAKQALSGQLDMVNNATEANWVSVRDQARKVLEETSKSLREIE